MDGGNPMQRQSTLDKAVAAGQIPHWRKWFHISFDPFKVPKFDANTFRAQHIPLAAVFYGAVLGYAAFAFLQFHRRPEVESFALASARGFGESEVSISVRCASAWGCLGGATDAGGAWTWTSAPSVEQAYGEGAGPLCRPPAKAMTLGRKFAELEPTAFSICPSRDPADGLVVRVPAFTAPAGCVEYGAPCQPRLVVTITGLGMMNVTMDLEPSQRKTLYVGLAVHRRGGAETPEHMVADRFYDGKNDDGSAELRVRQADLVQTYTVARPGSIPDVLAQIGGASSLLVAVLGALNQWVLFTAGGFQGASLAGRKTVTAGMQGARVVEMLGEGNA